MSVVIDANRCPQNHRCLMIPHCPVGVISQDRSGLPVIGAEKCIECVNV